MKTKLEEQLGILTSLEPEWASIAQSTIGKTISESLCTYNEINRSLKGLLSQSALDGVLGKSFLEANNALSATMTASSGITSPS